MLLKFFISLLGLSCVLSLPVTKTTKKPVDNHEAGGLENNLEYERYLKEIVSALESDPEFRQKLDQASEDDIRSGAIAVELEYVNHKVRSKLDEIKRSELERLRQLAKKQFKLQNDIDDNHLKISQIAHLDHENAHTFEIEDLKKLIRKTSEDLTAADKARREDFKQYELQKEFEKQQQIRSFEEEAQRAKYEAELARQQQKHNEHERIHHPGNKAQLEEVWEKQDHMEGADFDPQAFFMMHDLDGNGFWDETEVKALFVNELNKMYQAGAPEDDMRERAEEMERMREHVFNEADTNKDGLISYQEFVEQTKRDEYQKDPGWDTVDTEKVYTHEEYLEFERKRLEESQRLMAEHPEKYRNQQQNYHQQQQQHKQQLDQQHQQQQQQYQQQQYQPPPQQQQQYQPPPQQQQQYQPPPQQQQNQPPPQQQQQQNQPPPQQQQQNQPPPQQQQQYQPPPQQQQQIPVQQNPSNSNQLNSKQVYNSQQQNSQH